ncbi:hypothetical protein [Mangrovicoccus ximenensis]|nr:hypothetical protein [Mangrovicoccus ximenensis]
MAGVNKDGLLKLCLQDPGFSLAAMPTVTRRIAANAAAVSA